MIPPFVKIENSDRKARMEEVLTYIESSRQRYLSELREFIAIPSVSTNPEHRRDVERCARWIADHLTRIGTKAARILPTAGHPIVYSEWLEAPGKPTLLLYGHYDVQPVDPLELWTSPPFEATVRDGKLFGRGTADDKGQVFIHFKAVEAFRKNAGRLPVNLKMLLEGEEEVGSEHLESFIGEHRDLLKADLAVISDTAFFAPGVPSICYGLRGIVYMEVSVEGAARDLHSGTFGGSLHNPVQALAEIIARLHDRSGRVAIPGFYDDVRPLTKVERKAYRKLPWSDRKYARDLGVRQLYGEREYTTLERIWARPTLECNGIWGGFTGEGIKTVLPARASAKISMRLVPDQKPDKIARLFEKHIRTIAPPTVRLAVRYLNGGEPAITPLESPGIRAAVAALEKGFGKKPLYQRDGGSIPVVTLLKRILGLDTVLLGFSLPDDNAHAPDEFLPLDHFFGGIRAIAHFYHELPGSMSATRR